MVVTHRQFEDAVKQMNAEFARQNKLIQDLQTKVEELSGSKPKLSRKSVATKS